MRTLSETSPEEIARPSCRLFLDGPRARGRPHPAPGPVGCGAGSWAATSREWVRSAPWPSLVATAGSPWGAPSFALVPEPCPGEPRGARSPLGSWEDLPLPPGFQRGVETTMAWSTRHPVCQYPWPEGSPSICSPYHDGLGNAEGMPCQKHPRHGYHIYIKNPKLQAA